MKSFGRPEYQFSRNSTQPLKVHGTVRCELAGLVAAGWRGMVGRPNLIKTI